MCGINGVISADEKFLRKIVRMNELISHRGPDDEGFVLINSKNGKLKQHSGKDSIKEIKTVHKNISESDWKSGDVLLASRRLSIIDLSVHGHMPLADISGRYWIVHNGEIYNYIELREELLSKGYKFHSASDTEVIINSYIEWGTDCLNKFNGMWSFAVWDNEKNELFASRDRFGIKPFYYVSLKDLFAFSSEFKPLIYLLDNKVDIREKNIPYFLIYGNRLYSGDTYIKQIASLEAGHFLLYRKGKLDKRRYYEVKNDPVDENDPEVLHNKLIGLIEDSVRLRFRSDAAVGSCLSGGFDSSTIVSLSHKLIGKGLNTFSAVWKDAECDESRYIDIVNKKYCSVPNKVEPKAGEFDDVFDKICYYQEIPTEGPGLIPQWYVMQKAHDKVKVLLDGQGGDEVFGGYFVRQSYIRALLKDKKFRELLLNFDLFLKLINIDEMHRISNWVFPKLYNKYYRTYISKKHNILSSELKNKIDVSDMYYESETHGNLRSYLNNLSYHFISRLTIPTLLHYEDRSSMAHSVESRVPFLDYRLVEFGLNLSPEHLVNRVESRPLYRNAMSSILPKEIIERKDKLGFPVPFARWTRTVLKDYVLDKITGNKNIAQYVNMKYFDEMLNKHFEGEINFDWEIWRILSLDKFLKLKVN